MKDKVRLKGRLKRYFNLGWYLGFLLALVNIGVYTMNVEAGLFLTGFLAVYFLVYGIMYMRVRPYMMHELVSFATEYGQIQKQLLRELEVPYALLDDSGKVIWTNEAFEAITGQTKGYRKSITNLFPSITKDNLPASEDDADLELDLQLGECEYHASLHPISMRGMIEDSSVLEEEETENFLISMHLFDETALRLAMREIDDQSLAVGLIYLDNYDEALESVEEVRRSLLTALIERKVNKYVNSADGICKRLEKDKYIFVMRKSALNQLRESRFEILEDVKTVNIGNEMAVTISIGIGVDGLTYAQNGEFARNAIDLALGRGGDQAVVKTPETLTYYGGKSQQVEKSTRVKARVKAQALREIISGKDRVLIMGHRNPDIDSFGSAVGLHRIARSLDKEAHIVISDVPVALQPFVSLFRDNPEVEEDIIVNGTAALDMADANTVLIVVDVDRPNYTECPDLLKSCKTIVVLDHHRQSAETIENATLSYVEAYASSTCEMVSEILQYVGGDIKIRPDEADTMYGGIMVDTNNFMSKTGVRTFEAAAFLRRNGADVTRVRKLFREDANSYKARADAVSQAEIYRGSFAISVLTGEDLGSPTVVGAQAANELLNIRGIKASFVMTLYQGVVFVSARSIDEVNVQIIMERLGGGGHMSIAGCQMSGVSVPEAISALKNTLDTMLQEGAIE